MNFWKCVLFFLNLFLTSHLKEGGASAERQNASVLKIHSLKTNLNILCSVASHRNVFCFKDFNRKKKIYIFMEKDFVKKRIFVGNKTNVSLETILYAKI